MSSRRAAHPYAPRHVAVPAAAALLAALSLSAVPQPASAAAKLDNPYVGAKPYVNPDWSAKAAAEPGGSAVSDQPTFVWLDRIAAIRGTSEARGLKAHLDAAKAQGANLVQLVIYDLPGRDCAALASNGELAADDLARYQSDYIDPIAAVLADPAYASLRIVNLIEPDSLPNLVTNAGGTAGSTPQCATMKANGNYEKGVGYALHTLGALPNAYNYIDAGHHGWLGWDSNLVPSAQEFKKAATTNGASVRDVTGFIVNTANYSPTREPYVKITDTVNGTTVRQSKWIDWNQYDDETTFAQGLRSTLVAQGFDSGIGMLIDTSRNGWGGSARPAGPGPSTSVDAYVDGGRIDRRIHAGNWCNQSGAGLGERPATAPDTGIDAYVWAKPPGESDGASQPLDNDEGKGFDRMCDPTYAGNGRNGNNPTGALPDSPLAGHWFSVGFRQLLANAYPPVGGSGGGSDTQAPSAPTGLAVSATTADSVSLTWRAATDNTGVTGYDVYRAGTKAGSVTGTSYTDTGLAAATAYTYTVKARDAAGNVSAASAAVSATTKASGGGGGPTGLKAQYKNNDSSASDNQLRPGIQLVNSGSGAVDLSKVTVRYWFTGESASAGFQTWCDYAQPGCSTVRTAVTTLPVARTGADHTLDVTFTSGSLAAGASTGDLQLRLAKADWSNFDETDDYSRGTGTSYADAPKVTVYVNGTLAWGVEP
ncbi:cellulose 1,4-beta-cellobiosidase [Streptomyces sp. BK022]|uniref:glycoside hydrolase family 6 protein n=1 Tax=Streptomyces sp. BK022 TaxID=2512123 RepID=UPI00102A2636|nr:glycoside hydrolase family 6 protein [Streptomyces sp. BK022]RZU45991.1 cellulose 1,4-beta-cellobiosidase [Streptomyces sp. BK022]